MDSDLVTRRDDRPTTALGHLTTWVERGTLWVHVAMLTVVLVLIALAVRPGSVWTSDEGAVRSQVELLATSGAWSAERPFADIDPEEVLTPIHGASIEGDRYYPYTKHPLLPVLLTVTRAVGGGGALIAWSLLGALGCALVAAMIAARIEPRLRNATLWVVGLFTPVFFYAYTVLGHTVAAAISAALVLVVLGCRDRVSGRWVVVGILAAVAVLLRAESVLYAGAVALAVILDSSGPRVRLRLGLAGVIVIPAVAATVVNSWADAALGGPTPEEGEAILDAFRIVSGAFSSLILVDFGPPALAAVVITIVAATALLAVAVLREPDNRGLQRFLFMAGAAASVGLVILMPAAIGGVLAAVPFLLCGLLVMPRDLRKAPDVSLVLMASAFFVLMVVATQERGGGGVQWGGRYLLPMLPALVPVAVASLAALRRGRPQESRPLIGLLAVVSVVLAVNAAWTLADGRANSELMVDRLVATATAARPGTASTPVVMSVHTQIGRHAWDRLDDVEFLLIPEEQFGRYVDRYLSTIDEPFAYFGSLEVAGPALRVAGFVVDDYRWYPYFIARPDS